MPGPLLLTHVASFSRLQEAVCCCDLSLFANAVDSSFSVNGINLQSVWLGRQKNMFPISWQYWASQFPVAGEPGPELGYPERWKKHVL